MRDLQRHGVQLLAPFESIEINDLAMADTHEQISGRLIRSNYRELMTIYFELADDFSHDTVPFLNSLSPDRHEDAIRAVRTIWGTNNQMRRSSIEESLFNYLQDRAPVKKLTDTLKRYMDIGYLTFDKSEPGYRHPDRKQKTMDEFLSEAKITLADYDARESAG